MNGRLRGQSLLLAGSCTILDVLSFVVRDLPVLAGTPWVVVLLAIIAADLLLATPTRYAGLAVVAAVTVSAGGAALLGGSPGLQLNEAGVMVAAFRAGAWLRGGRSLAALAVVLGGLVLAYLARGSALTGDVLVEALKVGLVAWLVGRYTTSRRAYLEQLRRQTDLEERDAQEALDQALTEERAAIARDLHDVVTHHVSAISVHAGAARLRLTQAGADPAALSSVRSVEEASRSALGDLRDMLDLLQGRRSPPRPGLADVEDLLRGFRTASIPVRLETSGTARRLPKSLDEALYRVVQEMLTNALRHGEPGLIAVKVRFRPEGVDVETVNPCLPSRQPDGQGRGLAGMRKRVTALGGRMRAGASPDGRSWTTGVSFELPRAP